MFFRKWICSSSAAMCFCPWWVWCSWQPCSCCCPYISWSPCMPSPWEHTRPQGFMCQTPTDIPKRGSQPGSAVDQRAPLEMRGQQKVPGLLSETSTSLWERSTEQSAHCQCFQKGVVGYSFVHFECHFELEKYVFFFSEPFFCILQFCNVKCSVFLLLKVMNTSYFYVKLLICSFL